MKTRLALITLPVFILAGVLIVSSQATGSDGGYTWIKNPSNGHYYTVMYDVTWFEAEAIAVQWGGHLVTINDDDEDAWLVKQFKPGSYLIGFNDLAEEGTWEWVSGEPVTYTNFCGGEPNGRLKNVAIMEDAGRGDCWNDVPEDGEWKAVIEILTEPPIADAGPDQYDIEQTSHAGASVTLDGSGSYDPDSDPLTYSWTWTGGSATGVNPTATLPLGTTTVKLVVNDGTVDSDPDTVDITVEDTTDPTISDISANPEELWPPNHKMVPVIVLIVAEDICTETYLLEASVTVTSSEPDEDKGDGAFTGDVDGEDGFTAAVDVLCEFDEEAGCFVSRFALRAERDGRGVDRIYTITATVKDASGNEREASCDVIVPYDQGKGKK